MKAELYDSLVYRVPEIRRRYQTYRSKRHGKLCSLVYLLELNFSCYILRNKELRESMISFPKGTQISDRTITDLHELTEKLMGYDVVSFDVFDTLLFRTCEKPNKVFEQMETGTADFGRLRIEAEQKARKRLFQASGTNEVTIKEIYDCLKREYGIPAKTTMDIEIEAEKVCCYANTELLTIVQKLKQQGKRVIVISDMYLGADIIKDLLTSAEYELFDAYYVSCDYRVSKLEGELYSVVRQKERGYGTTFVHIGDNVVSDVKRALVYGFDAYYYKKQ